MCMLCASAFALGGTVACSHTGRECTHMCVPPRCSLARAFTAVYTTLEVEVRVSLLDEPLDTEAFTVSTEPGDRAAVVTCGWLRLSVETGWGMLIDNVACYISLDGSVVRVLFTSECGLLVESMRRALHPTAYRASERLIQNCEITVIVAEEMEYSEYEERTQSFIYKNWSLYTLSCGGINATATITLRDTCGGKEPFVRRTL